MVKDNFSALSKDYAAFRPGYPAELAAEIATLAPGLDLAWDCATGNGQMAVLLAEHFEHVFGSDISAKQVELAPVLPNITYMREPAHQCSLPNASADLVVVAQAIHWLDFDAFYAEVRRVLKPDGVIVVIGYPLLDVSDEKINAHIQHLYGPVLGAYWDPERRYLNENYATIPFPFEEIPIADRSMSYEWTPAALLGYISSWSALEHYRRKEDNDPLQAFAAQVHADWPESETVTAHFRILVRAGKV